MPRFAANLTLMFNEHAFLDRFDAAADAGFQAVEFLFPYDHPPEAVAERLTRNRLTPALFNMPPGDWAAGDRGTAAIAERRDELRASFDQALPYIRATGVERVHLMAGKAPRSAVSDATFRDNVGWTADRLADHGVTLVLEPLNTRDNPGYHLVDFDHAGAVIRDLARPNLKLQFDLYHRRAARRPRDAGRGLRGGGAQKPVDRRGRGRGPVAPGGSVAARAGRGPRAVQGVFHLRLDPPGQHRPGDRRAGGPGGRGAAGVPRLPAR